MLYCRYIWASGAQGSFSISEDKEGERLGRGTLLRIHLKDEAAEYLQDDKLKSLVERYSEFINFPIYLQVEKVRSRVGLVSGGPGRECFFWWLWEEEGGGHWT